MTHNPLADALTLVSKALGEGRSLADALEHAAEAVKQEEPAIAEAEHVAEAVAPAEAAAVEPVIAAVEHVADAIANPGHVSYPWLAASPVATAAPPPTTTAVAAVAVTEHGGGGQPATIHAPDGEEVPAVVDDPAPALSQNAPDYPGRGMVGDYAHSCGEEVARMALKATRGVSVPREYIVACIHGSETAPASTTPEQLAAYLSGPECNLRAEVDRQPWPHQVATIETQLAQDQLVILLGDWYGRGIAHFVLAKGYTATDCIYDDPWPDAGAQGERRITWRDMEAITQAEYGAMVLIKELARFNH